jgi:fumarate hydratase subunit beta
MIELKTPLTEEKIGKLRLGDIVYISGMIYTARDRAHERALRERQFPADLEGGVVFHAGPITEKEKGRWRIVAIGPTTSSRMNSLEPEFIKKFKVKAVIGKGGMDENVRKALKKNKAVYLSMTGGCAASASQKIKDIKGVYWLDLGIPEAVWALQVEKFGPLIVSIDAKGNSLYEKVDGRVEDSLNSILH